MKVGILSFPNSPSFGASLQIYGLYCALKNLGIDAEVINYKNTFMAEKRHFEANRGKPLKKMAVSLLDVSRKRMFRRFERRMKFYPHRTLCERDHLGEIEQRYDFIICGSDQVWNPNITGEDLNYFLCFCQDNTKRISYAASFGVCELSQSFSSKVKKQLELFPYISVREQQGAKIVSELLGRDSAVVLDPSMLVPQNEWKSLEQKIDGLPKKYIARFIFNHDENVEKQIMALSKRTQLPVVTVGGTILSKLKKGIFTGPIGPREWLYVLDHAEYVVTDSFHGAAFSIMFHKNFYVSLMSSTNSRLKNLIHTFDLGDRIVRDQLSYEKIDYCTVQMRMDEKKNDSVGFLKRAMGIGD